jgi:hypothetical protein
LSRAAPIGPGVTDYQTITLQQSGAVARITLNRPDAANGMNHIMTREVADAAARCDTAETNPPMDARESTRSWPSASPDYPALVGRRSSGEERAA